jgi:hypothetical protein
MVRDMALPHIPESPATSGPGDDGPPPPDADDGYLRHAAPESEMLRLEQAYREIATRRDDALTAVPPQAEGDPS